MDSQSLQKWDAELSKLLGDKFSMHGGDLAAKLKRLGRRLPPHARHAGQVLMLAQQHMAHPQLSKQIHWPEVERAYRQLRQHLRSVDVRERRRGAVLSLLGSLSFNLLAIVTLLLAVLIWRGLL